nr:hypothetical protein [Tanacetum cinerariifolium]
RAQCAHGGVCAAGGGAAVWAAPYGAAGAGHRAGLAGHRGADAAGRQRRRQRRARRRGQRLVRPLHCGGHGRLWSQCQRYQAPPARHDAGGRDLAAAAYYWGAGAGVSAAGHG